MFTGIVENMGIIQKFERRDGMSRLTIGHPFKDNKSFQCGQSIAVDGICLTVVTFDESIIEFDVLDETINKTNLKNKEENSKYNLEFPAKFGDEIGGHLITGHIDGTGEVLSLEQMGADKILNIKIKDEFRPWLISKGCISINGVSMTVVDVEDTTFSAHLIPTTLEKTNLSLLEKGDLVNLEFDQTAKYIHQYLEMSKK